MAVAIVDGPLGLEAKHLLRLVTLNDRGRVLSSDPTVYPWFELTDVTGLHDKAESDQPIDPLTGRIGEVKRRSQLRGKNVTYSGVAKALNMPSMRAAVTLLRNDASNENDLTVAISPHPAWGTIALSYFAHPAAFTCDESWSSVEIGSVPTVYQRPFVLTMRQHDPRYFALGDLVTVGAADGVAAAITAGGLAITEPVFTTASASATVDLENVTQGTLLRLLGLPGGGALIVDFVHRTVTQGGDDVTAYIDWSVSTWWDSDRYGVAPSAESLRVTGAGAWTVTVAPAVY